MTHIPPYNASDEEFELLLNQGTVLIKCGSSRCVYEIPNHSNKVLKVSKLPSNVTNWKEIVLYQTLTNLAFFGEIFSWSLSGKYLIMERLDDISTEEFSTLCMPDLWSDRKRDNVGRSRLDDRIKIRDYGNYKIKPEPIVPIIGNPL